MCGIAGLVRFDGQPVASELLERMTRALAHRGPDDAGLHLDAAVGLGHRRLSILDVSTAGHQPMAGEDGQLWITFNGEIFNYRELRAQLESEGQRFRSGTDTEVLLGAYRRWGLDCLAKLNGMFAFALWDAPARRLWVVRDRLGVKPLFYRTSPDAFHFASEIKAILEDPAVPREVDGEALAHFLALNYTPAPLTLFRGVRQLLPGHYLLVHPDARVQDVEYWDIHHPRAEPLPDAHYVERLRELLDDAVRLRLVSDVPFGVFLSGGLDSSSVAYHMSRHLQSPVRSFSVSFGDASFDEVRYAREVSRALGTDHTDTRIDADLGQVLPHLVRHAEEPTADSSMVGVYFLAREARTRVKMVLTGDGADELFAGYQTYSAFYLHRIFSALPRWLQRGTLSALLAALPARDGKVTWREKVRRFAAGLELSAEDAHATRRMIFSAAERAELLRPLAGQPGITADFVDGYRAAFARTDAGDPLDRMLYVDTRHYLPNDMLVKVDRMTMAHGLEARTPYLDYRLVEFAATVPPRLKLRFGLQGKYVLKRAMEGRLPERILHRAKAGFNIPNARWLREGSRAFVGDTLSAGRLRAAGLVDPAAVEALVSAHWAGQDHSHQLWCLLTLQLWWETFIARR